MEGIMEKISEWLHDLLSEGVISNLRDLLASVNNEVGSIATDVAKTPADFSPGVYTMVRSVSESVIVPIAGMILTFIACYELIQMIIDHNNLSHFDTWLFFRWIFKTFVAVMLVTHTFDITMAIFDVANHVIKESGGIISNKTAISQTKMSELKEYVDEMSNGALFGLYLQSSIVQVTLMILSRLVFVIVYGRMIEIYLMTSMAPIPMSTFGNREQSQIGQNYVRSLAALGFQGFLIMICVGIYAVLIANIQWTYDLVGTLWGIVGYTVLLCFTLFKTGSLSKSILNCH